MAVNAGELHEQITFLQCLLESNGSGGTVGTWVPLIETRAKVTRVKGVRNPLAGQIVHQQPYQIETRWRIDVTLMEQVKINHRGQDIIIHSLVEEDFKHRRFVYYGYADAKGPSSGVAEVQLYQDGSIQYYESAMPVPPVQLLQNNG